jgi:predicted amidohydrolase
VSIVLVPTATGTSNNPDQVAQTLVRARAAENHAFVVYANHAAGEGSLDLNGNSVVAGPFGKILGRSDSDDEELVYCTLELNVSEESRRVNPYQNDLRIDIL